MSFHLSPEAPIAKICNVAVTVGFVTVRRRKPSFRLGPHVSLVSNLAYQVHNIQTDSYRYSTGLGQQTVLRFGEFCYCSCLPLLPGFACSIHTTWEPPLRKPSPVGTYWHHRYGQPAIYEYKILLKYDIVELPLYIINWSLEPSLQANKSGLTWWWLSPRLWGRSIMDGEKCLLSSKLFSVTVNHKLHTILKAWTL